MEIGRRQAFAGLGGLIALALFPETDQFSQFLRLAFFRSPNYVAGSAGWTINQDGSAEFNNLTLRGTFFGTNYEIHSNGAFFYTGVPAAGNLFLSIAPAATTDRFGNTVEQGLGFYGSPGGGALPTFTIDTAGHFLAANEPELIWEDVNNAPNQPAGVGAQSSNASSFLELFSGKATLAGQASNIQLLDSVLSGIVNGTIQLNAGQVWVNGQIRTQGGIVAATAGSGSIEGWHNFGAPVAGTITVGNRARYKMLADSGLVLVDMLNITLPGAGNPVDGTVVWTAAHGLVSPYTPNVAFRAIAKWSTGGGSEAAGFEFESDGSIQIFGVGGTTVTRLDGQFIVSTI